MKSVKYILFAIFTTMLILCCKNEKKTEKKPTQMQNVMAIHDEIMPKMGVISHLNGELSKKPDSSTIGIEYETAINDLQAANKSMMDWMKGFGDRFDSDEIMNGKALSVQKQEWLDEEEAKVKTLRDQMYESIKNAEALLDSN